MKSLFTFLSLLVAVSFFAPSLHAQCGPNEVEVVVTIVPDNYPAETSWELRDTWGNLLGSATNAQGGTICVPDTSCLEFTIFDSFGDGICCSFGNGSYTVTYGGPTVATGGQFQASETTLFGQCAPGSHCAFADTVTPGSYVAPNTDYWYLFIPDSTGTYVISTCTGNSCNTVIWVYDYCQGLVWDFSNQGTVFYNDDECGQLAEVTGHFAGGTPYWIRIGGYPGCTGSINWDLTYSGPVVGCTDSLACNYNPLATVLDTCYYPGDSLCPDGPDLMVVQSAIETSMYMDVIGQADPCHVNEGCATGYGQRDILRFTTHIKNIGNQDYYIGDPTNNPQMFQYDNCHNHYHFDGYAEYILYDTAGQPLPIGFKNGFCVIDLECSGGGTAQYSCSNMGISHGCGDIYDASLDCQWIDITDVPSGTYTLVVRTNWDHQPDALGRHELDYQNNWAQVCIDLVKDTVNGNHSFTVLQNCPVYTDCMGTPFGSAVYDCEGVCDGDALHGDLDTNNVQEIADGALYVSGILGSTASVDDCSDLNADMDITVTDAALINACAIRGDSYQAPGGGTIDYCEFPGGILNINDTVSLRLANWDDINGTVDVEMYNPDNHVVGYQFELSGLNISSVSSLVPATDFPHNASYNASGTVIAVSDLDSNITKSQSWQPLVRVSYSQLTGNQICIDRIVDIVNGEYEDVVTRIEPSCIVVVQQPEPVGTYQVKVFPNPFSNSTTFEFEMLGRKSYELEIIDVTGHVVRRYADIRTNRLTIDRGELVSGLYMYRLIGEQEQVGKLIVR